MNDPPSKTQKGNFYRAPHRRATMKLPLAWRSISFLLASLLIISTGCGPRSPRSSDLDGSLADDGIEFREAWIAMPDAVRLAADLWVPEGGDPDHKYPVLLELSMVVKK